MRIRKHAQISSLVFAEAKRETYVCKLNQSPWDIIKFPFSDFAQRDPTASSQPPPPPPPLLPVVVVDGENGSIPNGSFSDCAGAENSELSSLKFELEKGDEVQLDDKNGNIEIIEEGNGMEEKNHQILLLGLGSRKSHGRKKVVKEGLSDYAAHQSASHLKRHNKLPKRSVSRRILPTKPASTNPYEFYYYTGFGPRWGRRRGPTTSTATTKIEETDLDSNELSDIGPTTAEKVEGGGGELSCLLKVNNNNVGEGGDTTPEQLMEALPTGKCTGGFDYIEDEDDEDDDDDEDDEDEDSGEFVKKKRARKPIKARSLRSLM